MIDATRINGWLWPKMAALRAGFSRWSRKVAQLTFSTDDRILLYEDLAFLLDNRIPIKTALSSMRDTLCRRQKRQPPTVHCLNDAIAALNSGGSLDQGLKGWLPTNETAILSAGVKKKGSPLPCAAPWPLSR